MENNEYHLSHANLGYPTIILSTIFFYINNYWILKTLSPASVKTHPRKAWKWRNTANSLLHSFITGSGACLCFWWTPAMREDLIYPITMPSYLLVCFSIGYFIYDLLDMAINDPKPKTYELLLHHFTVISCFMVSMTTQRYMGYTLMALLVEVNSVFLHVRQLMILQGWSKATSLYRINNSFNLGTFVVFRILTLGWMTRWLIHHKTDLHNFEYYIAGISLAVIMVMNTILLQRLLNSDYWQCPKPSTEDHLKIDKIFENVIANTVPISGRIEYSVAPNVVVSSTWIARNVCQKMSISSQCMHIVRTTSSESVQMSLDDSKFEVLRKLSPSNKLRAVIKNVPATTVRPRKQCIEIWTEFNNSTKSYDLTVYNRHGDVYPEVSFGCFEWSKAEDKIMFVVEKKVPVRGFFSNLFNKCCYEKQLISDDILFTSESNYTEIWSNSIVKKLCPTIAVFTLQSGSVSVIGNTPNNMSLGQGVWAPGGIVCVGWKSEPCRLGDYCIANESWIYFVSDDFCQFSKISKDGLFVASPKFSPNGEYLIWLEREATIAHHGSVRLMKLSWKSEMIETVVDIIDDYVEINEQAKFYGLYNTELVDCWLKDNKTIIVSTPQLSSVRTFVIDTCSREVQDITGNGEKEEFSIGVFHARENYILCWRSSLNETPSLILGEYNKNNIKWHIIGSSQKICDSYIIDVIKIPPKTDKSSSPKYMSAIYYGPKDEVNAPFLVWLHSGPQSSFTNSYNSAAHFFAAMGFGMVLVNYRGSTGAGQKSIDFLAGNIGVTDVADVHNAAQRVLYRYPDQLDNEKCVLFGSSHGGFLALHLAGRFPNMYKAVAVRNPVVDIGELFYLADVPTWAITEMHYLSTLKHKDNELKSNEIKQLHNRSPVVIMDKIISPVLLICGMKESGIHPRQGHRFYQGLKANRTKTKMICYNEHDICKTPKNVNFLINSAHWFTNHINHNIKD